MTGSSLAIWRGSPNHYAGRNGYAIDHITLHIMVGSLAGTDTLFQRADSGASSTYGVGSDGTIYQWVDEDDGAWTDANYMSNNSAITIEHAGGLAQIPVTDEEIEASARLCADIAQRHGWDHLWHDGLNGNVWLHREIPGTDHFGCPDNTINGLPVGRVLDRANEILEGDNMPSAQEIADAVVNYELNGVKLRDRIIGTDGAANNAARNIQALKTVADRNDSRLNRILLSLKRFTGVKDDDTTTVPDLTQSWLDKRVYRLTLIAKRLFGLPDDSTTLPDTLALTDTQLDAIAERVADKLATKEAKND